MGYTHIRVHGAKNDITGQAKDVGWGGFQEQAIGSDNKHGMSGRLLEERESDPCRSIGMN